MTTSVTITHTGHFSNDVLVRVYKDVSEGAHTNQYSRRLRKDDSETFLVYSGQFLEVSEVAPLNESESNATKS